MQFRVLATILFSAVYAAATLTPADCDCHIVCNSTIFSDDNCYNGIVGCGTLEEPSCCEICGCNCP